ncbi:MAG: threonine ammonia-lyase [Methanomicrobiales archaeon]
MVTYEDIVHAKEVIAPHIIRTPLIYSPTFSEMTGLGIYLKLETLQKAGSFKVRGATYRILNHTNEIGKAGVIAASAGNHAQGVAVAARMAGVQATIVMPVHASLSKQAATKSYGADIILKGDDLQESIEIASALAVNGATFIHPYNDPDIIAGQGTIGIEIQEDLQSIDTIIVPVGGGGLISGIAIAVKAKNPAVRIIGVQAAACPSAFEALRKDEVVTVVPGQSVADGILVPQVGALALPVLESLVDEIILLSEEEIIDAMLFLLERKKILAEGAGAAPVAALLNNHISIPKGSNVVLVISGGNVDTSLLAKILNRGLVRKGRIMHISVRLRDIPGSLAGLLSLIAQCEGNILNIGHCKDDPGLPPGMVIVDIDIETRGPDHVKDIELKIRDAGFLPG